MGSLLLVMLLNSPQHSVREAAQAAISPVDYVQLVSASELMKDPEGRHRTHLLVEAIRWKEFNDLYLQFNPLPWLDAWPLPDKKQREGLIYAYRYFYIVRGFPDIDPDYEVSRFATKDFIFNMYTMPGPNIQDIAGLLMDLQERMCMWNERWIDEVNLYKWWEHE